MESHPKEIRRYITKDGKIPFAIWIDALRDSKVRAKINERLRRASLGNLGDFKSLADGVFELRIDYGSGYRVYFGQVGSTIVLLLCGGDKSTQTRDIRKAKEYWADYEQR
ncbi:type II toxin-antitoxin system RelE/ParE family toxin [Tumidithrix elongata RA019]|uniref:Type II toxin-antitoxin system RelE/ParE family toxin n=1 Tax=Tumidithrix elongata BACA0141 TaxID=2716417 RepID=A0AAW9PYM0_9CYAN|nr:type II toxin-antitoxin system RelE/ParE family toxin [Tumidithrix elongata RA019]